MIHGFRLGLSAGLIGMAFAVPALATGDDENQEATALLHTKQTLGQAITTAEQRTGGKAFDAGVDIKGHATRIAVETNGPPGVQTVDIDPSSGRVVGHHAGGETD